jgi:hypothetical protein
MILHFLTSLLALFSCSFQYYDYSRFEKDRILTAIADMTSRRTGVHSDETNHTIRGIESRHSCERDDLLRGMQEEQQRQRVSGTFPDVEIFHQVSIKYSKAASDRALQYGQRDAKACRPKGVNPVVSISRHAAMSMNRWIVRGSEAVGKCN